MRRGQLISFSAQGMRVQEISNTLHLHEEYVRQLIRQYNEGGLTVLRTRARPGRPSKLTLEDESVVVEIATMPPRCLRPTVQPVVVAQADRLPGGKADDSRGLSCDHRQRPGRA